MPREEYEIQLLALFANVPGQRELRVGRGLEGGDGVVGAVERAAEVLGREVEGRERHKGWRSVRGGVREVLREGVCGVIHSADHHGTVGEEACHVQVWQCLAVPLLRDDQRREGGGPVPGELDEAVPDGICQVNVLDGGGGEDLRVRGRGGVEHRVWTRMTPFVGGTYGAEISSEHDKAKTK